ncbi:hypothetical protein K490DRAFT_64127 [Saccharata proteae CBS 121410]|uniref:26S proteasome complex subunit SEM1 n=1 Tax=Saccharata proteae CBS 121410 TaxID=1314787 RepID=A0A6A5YAN2_9PEZI|nr:hypothetical protein K490DRAFT_64127 [Saccharata proteae CBS 121410]
MSGAAQGTNPTAKAVVEDAKDNSETMNQQKPTTALEEDDEFEDFPVDDWDQEDAEEPAANTHLWEESWDDDDTSEDFSAQLKEELKKVEASKQ